MKRFSDISSVVHAFAHQTYPECATYNRNVWYESNVVFSYGRHFPMGRMLLDKSGRPHTVLLTWRTYSSSTGNHQRKLAQAVNHLQRHYVCDPETPFSTGAMEETVSAIKEHLLSAARRRSADLRQNDVAQASYKYTQLNDLKSVPELAPAWKALSAHRKRQWTDLGKLLEAATTDAVAALAAMSEADKKAAAAARKKAEALRKEAKKNAAADLELWLAGGDIPPGQAYNVKQHLGMDGLRLSPIDETRVETTQRAVVPAADCRKAWPVIQAAWASIHETSHGTFRPDAKLAARYRLGNYTISEIRSDGSIQVGCHLFPRNLVERLAKQLGLE